MGTNAQRNRFPVYRLPGFLLAYVVWRGLITACRSRTSSWARGAGMSRRNDAAIGKLIAADGSEVEITRLRIDTDGIWWAGSALLFWGSILFPGLCRLVMNDGRAADVIVDEIRGERTGGERAIFRGYGPAPDWATRSQVYRGGAP